VPAREVLEVLGRGREGGIDLERVGVDLGREINERITRIAEEHQARCRREHHAVAAEVDATRYLAAIRQRDRVVGRQIEPP
jgi:hypothetical protein